MNNLHHQHGCHDCLHAKEKLCDDCCSPIFIVCLFDGEKRPDIGNKTELQLKFASTKKEEALYEEVCKWDNAHKVQLWSICDDYMPEKVLTEPVKYVLETKDVVDLFDLSFSLVGKQHSILKENLMDKVRSVICMATHPVNGIYTVRLSEFGFSVLNQSLTILKKSAKKADLKWIEHAMEIVAKFKSVKLSNLDEVQIKRDIVRMEWQRGAALEAIAAEQDKEFMMGVDVAVGKDKTAIVVPVEMIDLVRWRDSLAVDSSYGLGLSRVIQARLNRETEESGRIPERLLPAFRAFKAMDDETQYAVVFGVLKE